MSQVTEPAHVPPLSFWQWLRAWINMLFADHSIFRLFYNTRTKVADGLYRSGHPMPYQLRAAQRTGVRSVISLRGAETHIGSNQLEWQTCQELKLPLVHYPIGSRDTPSREQVQEIIRLFRTLPRPILVHCKSGADRAGLASTIFLLTEEHRPIDEAMKQLEFWRHGHLKQAKTGVLDKFFETYRAYQQANRSTTFEDWLANHYDREAVRHAFHSSWWANQIVDRLLKRE
jgi:protein tyrosine phosphatase (PTP) superfamily phosphohydrolase (DUF442 family)